MARSRKVLKVLSSRPTLEGAGVHLRRAFGFGEVPEFDPFLLLDDFRSDTPEHFRAGFPWHPHRGIETITYVLAGEVEHGDSLGNRGIIGPGDVQWMTAGSGIIHQEMPKGDDSGRMYGFQLWANLPAPDKMMPPRYREVKAKDIPKLKKEDGVVVRVICGEVDGVAGPVKGIVTRPRYLDVSIPARSRFSQPTDPEDTVFAYVIEGGGHFGEEGTDLRENHFLLKFGAGDFMAVSTEADPVRFLLISGNPIREPVAWQGPIVMNTEEELEIAFQEYRSGTFLKHAS